MEAITLAAGITVFALGYLASYLNNRERIKNLKRKHARHLHDLPTFDDGWNAALSEPSAVKKAHRYFFQNRP